MDTISTNCLGDGPWQRAASLWTRSKHAMQDTSNLIHTHIQLKLRSCVAIEQNCDSKAQIMKDVPYGFGTHDPWLIRPML